MATRTRRIAGTEQVLPTSGAAIFTCPGDRTAIVKDVRAQNRSGGQARLELHLATSGVVCRIGSWDLPNGGHAAIEDSFIVLQEGDSLRALLNPSGNVAIWASGALLEGDPA